MEITTLFVAALLLAGSLGASNAFAPAPGVISNTALTEGSYCHLTFPAIREETLSWDRPVLKDPSAGDIIDYYGSWPGSFLWKECDPSLSRPPK